jgi:hypothetical protein
MTPTLSNTPTPDPAKRPAKPAPQPIHIVPRPNTHGRGFANAIDLSLRIIFVALVVVVGVIFASLITK